LPHLKREMGGKKDLGRVFRKVVTEPGADRSGGRDLQFSKKRKRGGRDCLAEGAR